MPPRGDPAVKAVRRGYARSVLTEPHAALGWAIGALAPGSDRRLRAWCTIAGVFPDIDAAAYLWGEVAYMNYHHTFGHNVFTGVLLAAAAAAWPGAGPARRRAALFGLTALSFAGHLLTDMKLSAYPVHLLWPLSKAGWEFTPNLGLGAPINTWLVWLGLASIVPIAWLRGVTPLELVSPRLDQLVRGALRWPRAERCATCDGGTNHRCDRCGKPACLRHAALDRRLAVACPTCAGPAPG